VKPYVCNQDKFDICPDFKASGHCTSGMPKLMPGWKRTVIRAAKAVWKVSEDQMIGSSVRPRRAVKDRETVIMMMNVLGPWSVARITVGSITHLQRKLQTAILNQEVVEDVHTQTITKTALAGLRLVTVIQVQITQNTWRRTVPSRASVQDTTVRRLGSTIRTVWEPQSSRTCLLGKIVRRSAPRRPIVLPGFGTIAELGSTSIGVR